MVAVGVGVVFGYISCSCSTFTHYQSLTKPVTFKTMFNIVKELTSFKTIILGRGEWWKGVVGVGGGQGSRVGWW